MVGFTIYIYNFNINDLRQNISKASALKIGFKIAIKYSSSGIDRIQNKQHISFHNHTSKAKSGS